MRQAAKVDANQPETVETLRRWGISVQPIHQLGKGVPDLLIGYAGWNFLIELKVSAKDKRTEDEIDWQMDWKGQVDTLINALEIVILIHDRLQRIEETYIVKQAIYRLGRIIEHEKLKEEEEQHDEHKANRTRWPKGSGKVNRLPKTRKRP